MYKENFEYLNDTLKYMGFGEGGPLNKSLSEAIDAGEPAFDLTTEAWFDDETRIEVILHFKKSATTEAYFFTKYDALLRYRLDESKNKLQTFYVYKGSGVTFKEAYNLLCGRAVNRTFYDAKGEKYNAWVQLDFDIKDLHGNYKLIYYREPYNYPLEQVLESYPIREMKFEDLRANLIRAMRRGNIQLVTFERPQKTEKVLIEANPQTRAINIYSLATRARSFKDEKDQHPIPEEEQALLTDPTVDPGEEESEHEPEHEPEEVVVEMTQTATRTKKRR